MTDDKLTIAKLRDALITWKNLQASPTLVRIEVALGESLAFFDYLGIDPASGPLQALPSTLLGVEIIESAKVRPGESRSCYSDGTDVVKRWRANGL